MKTALSPTAAPAVKLRPLAQQVPYLQWQEDLSYLEKEVNFYQKLLKIGIPNCPENSRAMMYRLLDGFSNFLVQTLTELKSQLASLDLEMAEPSLILAFQRKLDAHFLNLRELKENVFPHIHHMQRISFW